jgi:hypothetical protein
LPDGQDKRNAPRYRVLGHAQILGRNGAVNCVIRDLSDTGAKLGVAASAKLPAEFDLWLVQRKVKLRARLMWRRGEFAGVAFCTAQPALAVFNSTKKNFIIDA